MLRNGWYFEKHLTQLPSYLRHGIAGAAGDGQVSGAARAEYAEAAAAVVARGDHNGAVYELGGDPFTLTELAATISAVTGQQVGYTNLSQEQFRDLLVQAGLPAPVAAVYADVDPGIAAGEPFVEGHDLEKLVGHPLTPLRDAVAAAAKAHGRGADLGTA